MALEKRDLLLPGNPERCVLAQACLPAGRWVSAFVNHQEVGEIMLQEILLVDDSDSDNYYHRRVIKKSGLCETVSVATSVDEGIAHLRGQPMPSPSLIFLDINMPGKDGWDFLTEFRELPAELRASLVVVMLTSSTHDVDQAKAREFGIACDYLVKPLSVETLQALIEEKLSEK
tara:strand:+ start:34176 stop:34697 length:522 start_codon:yes stop_codon:yes gene_type:complete